MQPLYNLVLMGFFEWGVALHDLNFDAIRAGEKSKKKVNAELKAIGVKARKQIVKDYIAFPLLSAAAATAAGQRGRPLGSRPWPGGEERSPRDGAGSSHGGNLPRRTASSRR